MTRLEMERRAAEWMGLDVSHPYYIPRYGSDLNLWPPIYEKLSATPAAWEAFGEALKAITCERLHRLERDPHNPALAYIGATAEDRLWALFAVLDSLGRPE